MLPADTPRQSATPRCILIADDDPTFLNIASRILRTRFEVDTCRDPEQVVERLRARPYQALLLDLYFDEVETDLTGFDVIETVYRELPEVPIIVLSRSTDMRDATRALDLGAFHFVSKHFERDELVNLIDRAVCSRRLEEQIEYLRSRDALVEGDIVYKSDVMQDVMDRCRRYASSDSPILITGETGTGKDLVARVIHEMSRPQGQYVAVNITALPDTLFEAQLFGHERGAFTDARVSRKGLIEICDGGTLFLDEIGSLSPERQVALLRVIEDGRVRRVGSETERFVDVRFIVATNEDLAAKCERGEFRKDLWYRVSSLHIHLPPLCERDNDVLYIADQILQFLPGRRRHRLAPEVRMWLLSRKWPGNVRELRFCLERAALYDDDGVISLNDLSRSNAGLAERTVDTDDDGAGPAFSADVETLLPYERGNAIVNAEFRRRCVEYALAIAANNLSEASRLLGISRQSLYSWMDEFGYSRSAESE